MTWAPPEIALKKPLARAVSSTPLKHDIICLHTMVGTLAGSWNWSNRPGGTYWTFGVGGRGECWQCCSLDIRAAANLYGNWRVIPIETADSYEGIWGSPPSCGNVPGWTAAQINKLAQLIAWLCARYNIPPVLIPDTQAGRRGIAYHRQGIDPHRHPNGEKWSNSYGKCCPDHRRIWQLQNEVIPRVRAILNKTPATGGGFLMSLTSAQQKDLYAKVSRAELYAAAAMKESIEAVKRTSPDAIRRVAQEAIQNMAKYGVPIDKKAVAEAVKEALADV